MSLRCIVAAVLFIFPSSLLHADELFQQFLAKVPDNFNTMIYINLEGLNNSPIGKKEGWEAKCAKEYGEGIGVLPPTIKRVLFSRHIDMTGKETPLELGLAETTVDVSLDRIKTNEKGSLETVAGKQVLMSPRGYFVPLDARQIALISGTNKQTVAQWIRSVSGKNQITMPDHMRHAMVASVEKAHMVMSINLADLIETDAARKKLEKARSLKGKPADREFLARLASTCTMVRMEVTAKDEIQYSLHLEFDQPIGNTGEYLAALLNETLEDFGLDLDELPKGKVISSDKSVRIEGKLEKETLRYLMLASVPSGTHLDSKAMGMQKPAAPNVAPAKNPPENNTPEMEDPKLAASKKYWKAVTGFYDEFLTAAKRSTNYERTANLVDIYSKKIDQLSVIDVDPELINFSGRMTDRMRAIAASLRGVQIEVNAVEAQIRTRTYADSNLNPINYFYMGSLPRTSHLNPRVWAWSTGSFQPNIRTETNLPEVIAEQRRIIAQGEKARQELLKEVENDRASTRKKMQAQFKITDW